MNDLAQTDVDISEASLGTIRERVLKAEQEKLNLDLPRGILDDIEEIVREEITE
jgi:hypothetical protein